MATVLFVVKATIRRTPKKRSTAGTTTNTCRKVLQFKGVVSGAPLTRRWSEEKYQYMAVYELQDEATYRV